MTDSAGWQRIAELEAELADYRHLFDLQQRRMEAATVRWRQEAPNQRATITPDLGELLGWLLDRLAGPGPGLEPTGEVTSGPVEEVPEDERPDNTAA